MKIQLVDHNKEMCEQWQFYFLNCEDVFIHHGDIFSLKTDCIVSPANSFGFMDGGLDLVISKRLGWHIQDKLQEIIKKKYFGELLVGQAELIETDSSELPYCISAPTMRVPLTLVNSINVYLASKAIFKLVKMVNAENIATNGKNKIKSVTISGLGTGVGQVPFEICAKQMKKAYEDIWLDRYEFPKSLFEAHKTHDSMFKF